MRNGLSIRNKFILVVLSIFIVLISFSLFLIGLISQLAGVTSQIVDHPLEVSNAASYANVEVLRMHRDLKEILLVDEDFEINILIDKIRVSESKVYTALDTIAYEILGTEGKVLQENTRVLFDDWKIIRSEIIEVIKNGNKDKALEIMSNKGADHIEVLERNLFDLNQYARIKAIEFQENSIELEASTESTAIFGIISVLVFVLLAIYWMSWSVLGRIGTLRISLNDIIRSGELKTVTLTGNDELTELSGIFNNLVSSLGNQLWIKEGSQILGAVLSEDTRFDENIQNYVESLCGYGDFLSVAYYHNDDNMLNLKGVVNRVKFMEDAYAFGYHAIGECAQYDTARIIKYDANEYDLPYKEIVIKPVSYNDSVYGVVCIVYHNPSTNESEGLLSTCLKDFSAYISTFEQRRKIDDLLEESINTNEQLTNRQSSLEENQEELEAVNRTLQDQRDLLNGKSIELVQQNKELVNLREELVSKYRDLEEVTNYRSQFLTNISHELRTPLNSIVVLSNMLKEKSADEFNDDDVDKIEVITKASDELLSTINDILDLSKVESGKVELYEEVFEINQLLNEWQAIYNPLLEKKGLKSRFENRIKNKVFGDKSKISHIITNFLSNAIKFTSSGSIKVVMSYNDDIDFPMSISVTDTGIGIKTDKFEAIFDEFVQNDGSISRLYGGTGLGLSICRNYTRLINGKINVESELGVGSTFTLYLPSTCLLDDYTQVLGVKDLKDRDAHHSNKNLLFEKNHLKKILICDDEPMNVFALSAMLEDVGVSPVAALSYEEAVMSYQNNPIEMILMDYMMPGIDGFETIKKLKALKEWKDIPIVIITAAHLEADDLEIIKSENYMLVRKPIIYNEIVALLNDKLT